MPRSPPGISTEPLNNVRLPPLDEATAGTKISLTMAPPANVPSAAVCKTKLIPSNSLASRDFGVGSLSRSPFQRPSRFSSKILRWHRLMTSQYILWRSSVMTHPSSRSNFPWYRSRASGRSCSDTLTQALPLNMLFVSNALHLDSFLSLSKRLSFETLICATSPMLRALVALVPSSAAEPSASRMSASRTSSTHVAPSLTTHLLAPTMSPFRSTPRRLLTVHRPARTCTSSRETIQGSPKPEAMRMTMCLLTRGTYLTYVMAGSWRRT
mmetsp:Transcript_100754/g.285600  ORF Transcript_100754/g.285600 Transcript_100754/m.285600 type:complete len:268 (+) Transcript_100754:434-1237(+)